MLPSTMSMCSACGTLGSPGIRSISPAMATSISAPLPMGYVIDAEQHFQIDPVTAPYILGSAEKEYCVLAMQMG